MPEQSSHPSREELSAYSLGQIPQERAVVIDSHISECQPCCETIVGLSSDDTFVALLQEARQLPADQTVAHDGPQPQPSSSSPDIPAQLAEHLRYEIVRLIGKGGMGDVYEARHRKMERTVALKVINRELVRKPEAVDRFHREVKTAAQLSHPNIVTAHDADQAGDFHFMVMEYVDGVDLSHIIKDRGALPIAETCDYVRQAAIGLQHAHEQGMVHRDIKPHNLMVTADGTVKILDFGLASLAPEALPDTETVEARGDLTAAGAIMGTPDFISPEQADDARQADIRSDIYSLGTTLYFLLTGRPPFADGSVMHKLKSHAQVDPEPLESLRDDVPADLAAVVSRMMAKNPNERFQTPAEVAEALESFSRTSQPVQEDSPPLQVEPRRQHSRLLPLTAIAMLFVAAIVAAIVYYIQTDNGIVRVEVNDPSLTVTISDQTITMEDDGKPLTIRAGHHKLTVQQGDLNFETDSFQIRRGEKIAFKVERLSGEVVVLKDGERAGAWKSQGPSTISVSSDIAAMLAHSGQSEAEFKKKLHTAISQAAGIPNAQWEKFATDPTGSPEAIEGVPLSYLLLVRPTGPAPKTPDASEDFHMSEPRDLIFDAMSSSQEFGYVSLIQPEYIKHTMLDIDAESKLLRGTVQFEAPKLYAGKVNFAARYDAGRPKVVEFTLPKYRLTIVSDEKGVWRGRRASAPPPTEAQAARTATGTQGGNASKPDIWSRGPDGKSNTNDHIGNWKPHEKQQASLKNQVSADELAKMANSLSNPGNTADETAHILVHDRKSGRRALYKAIAHGDAIIPLIQKESKDFTILDGRNALWIAEVLGAIQTDNSRKVLVDLYARTNELARLTGAVGLARQGALPDPVNESSFLVRVVRTVPSESETQMAILALGLTKDEKALPSLLDILKKRPLDKPSVGSGTHAYACEAIASIGSKDAIPVLRDCMKSEQFYALPSAFNALIALGDREAVPLAIARLTPEVRRSGGGEGLLQGLRKVTGQTSDYDQANWKAWWSSVEGKWQLPEANDDERDPSSRLKAARHELTEMRTRYTDKHPAVQSQLRKIAELERQAASPAGSGELTLDAHQPDQALSQAEDIAFFEKTYNTKITSVRPIKEYPDPALFYSAVAQQLGIPEKAFAAAKANGWKEDPEKFQNAIVNRLSATARWQIIISQMELDRKNNKVDRESIEITMLELDDHGKAHHIELSKQEAEKRKEKEKQRFDGGLALMSKMPHLADENQDQGPSPAALARQISEILKMADVEVLQGLIEESREPVDKGPLPPMETDEKIIAELLDAWKRLPDQSEESEVFAKKISTLHNALYKQLKPNTESSRQTSARLALLAWPHLSDAIPKPMAQTLADLTKPDAAIRMSDRLAEAGRPTEPLGWDVQAAHALALARAGKTEEALRENQALMKKMEVNVRKGRLPEVQLEFLGATRTQKSLLKQTLLQNSLILAIAGRTAESVDASTAAVGVEVNKPTQADQAAIQAMLRMLGKAHQRPSDDAQMPAESDASTKRKS